MAKIAVFEKSLARGGYREVASSLEMTFDGATGRVTTPGRYRVESSHELAKVVLGIREVPCPNIGLLPAYGTEKGTFRVKGRHGGDSVITEERCSICGFSSTYSGNPGFRATFGDELSRGVPHPYRTYPIASQERGAVSEASWKSEFGKPCLDISADDGTLIIWMCGLRIRKDSAERAALRKFPNAKLLADKGVYLILYDKGENIES